MPSIFPQDDDGDPLFTVLNILKSSLVLMAMVSCVMACACYKYILQALKSSEPKMAKKIRSSLRAIRLSTRESQSLPSAVKMDDFPQHLSDMISNEEKIKEEFDMVKSRDVAYPSEIAAADENCNKNRFFNILPFDDTRVKVTATEGSSDYINASYIKGYNSDEEFIAAQGPMKSTTEIFWKMVWEKKCRAIVMLTRFVDYGRERCFPYYPRDFLEVSYGDLSVTLLETDEVYAYQHEWIKQLFLLKKGEETHKIFHFQFVTWPDFGPVEPPMALLKFWSSFREEIPSATSSPSSRQPIVVHCSAGVGRTGTFIALDILIHKIWEHDAIDIPGVVCTLRKQRKCMVQGAQQYMCIYLCLQKYLQLEGKHTPEADPGEETLEEVISE